jgi:hypothetical protein
MAADDQPQTNLLINPPPEESIRNATTSTTGGTAGSDVVQETPERIAARGELDALNARHQEAMDAQAENDKATALVHQQAEEAKLAQMDADAAARDKALQATQPGIDEWRTRLRESMDKYDKAPAPALFADKSTPDKILSGIGLALAGLGDAIGTRALIASRQTGGLDQFNSVPKLIEADLQRQRENLSKLNDRIVMAKTGLGDAQAARAQLLAEIDQRGAVAYKRADQVAAARLAAQGVPAAEIKSKLDQLGWEQKSEDAKLASVSPLVNHVTETQKSDTTREFSDTKNINEKPTQATVPTVVTDRLSGRDLPVDPARTDARQHNAAVAKLAAANTILATTNDLLSEVEKNGPATNETIAKFLGGPQVQAKLTADVQRIHSAYAASKGESTGAYNQDQLSSALPPPPSSADIRPGAAAAWLAKVKSMRDEQLVNRAEALAAAGVPPQEINRTMGPAKNAHTDRLTAPTATPGTPQQAPAPTSERDRIIQRIKAHPNDPKNALAKKVYGVTDQELAAP